MYRYIDIATEPQSVGKAFVSQVHTHNTPCLVDTVNIRLLLARGTISPQALSLVDKDKSPVFHRRDIVAARKIRSSSLYR